MRALDGALDLHARAPEVRQARAFDGNAHRLGVDNRVERAAERHIRPDGAAADSHRDAGVEHERRHVGERYALHPKTARGYIQAGPRTDIRIRLKYVGRVPVVSGLKRISKPGLRVYAGKTEIPRVLGGLGVVIVSTSQGIMTGAEARKGQLGGEILAYVW